MSKRNLTLLTDFYQLTMMNGYLKQEDNQEQAVFDVFFRQNGLITYSIVCGLEQVVDYILNLHFDDDDIAYLKSLGVFDQEFLDYLKTFKFTGDVYAVPEGTVIFPGEPILTVKAPVIEAQLVETAILNIMNFQTLIATKAAKICYAAKGDAVMEFGLRRAQAPDAGIYGARAAIIGGCSSTSNVLAGQMFGVPIAGTHAHSWVMNFKDEYTAFMEYAKNYPDSCTLLVDTYDTLKQGVPNAIKVFDWLKENGHKPVGIRLDSGDLSYLSKKARTMLDDAGHADVKICASGDLDEYSIRSLKHQDAKINLWGVGTKLITSADMPALGGVYKLCAIIDKDGTVTPKIKISETVEKITNPGIKNTYRIYDKATGKAEADMIYLRDEEPIDQTKTLTLTHPTERWKKITFDNYYVKTLQVDVIKNGKLVYDMPSLNEIKCHAQEELESFWDEYKRLDKPHIYKVDLSDGLYELKKQMLDDIKNKNIN